MWHGAGIGALKSYSINAEQYLGLAASDTAFKGVS